MAVLKLSQIAVAGAPPAVTDQAVFVTGGTTDNLVTVTQLAAGLPAFTAALKGSVPASGGGTTNFLRADGTFASPATVAGGSPGQVLFNSAGAETGMSGTSWDNTNLALTITGATVTTSNPILNLLQTWNAGGVTFNGLQLTITNTASAAGSRLINAIVGATPEFQVLATGEIIVGDGSNFKMITWGGDNTRGLRAGGGGLQFFDSGGFAATISSSTFTVQEGVTFDWASVSLLDLIMRKDSAGGTNAALAIRNAANPQTLRVFNTFTDASNFERAAFDWTTSANVLTIGTQNLGTGSARGINIVTAGTNAITISSAQLVALPAITTDAAHTDSTLCQDTTTHAIYFGSGAAGICLGTSSIRFKHGITDLDEGLSQILALRPITYRYNHQPDQDLYGFTAEDVVGVIPRLVRSDKEGRPNSVDHIGMLAVIVNAIKEQQIMIDELKDRFDGFSAGKH